MEPYDTIDRLRHKDSFGEPDVLALRELTDTHPEVPELWDVLGDVIQLARQPETPSDEAFACYQRAIECDATYAPAHESLGYFRDLSNEFEAAEHHFRLAIQHGRGDTARIGLARVLSQLGRAQEANLEMSLCADQQDGQLLELRREIADGLWIPDEDFTG